MYDKVLDLIASQLPVKREDITGSQGFWRIWARTRPM